MVIIKSSWFVSVICLLLRKESLPLPWEAPPHSTICASAKPNKTNIIFTGFVLTFFGFYLHLCLFWSYFYSQVFCTEFKFYLFHDKLSWCIECFNEQVQQKYLSYIRGNTFLFQFLNFWRGGYDNKSGEVKTFSVLLFFNIFFCTTAISLSNPSENTFCWLTWFWRGKHIERLFLWWAFGNKSWEQAVVDMNT